MGLSQSLPLSKGIRWLREIYMGQFIVPCCGIVYPILVRTHYVYDVNFESHAFIHYLTRSRRNKKFVKHEISRFVVFTYRILRLTRLSNTPLDTNVIAFKYKCLRDVFKHKLN